MIYIIQLITALLGAAGFALLWNVEKKCIFPASFCGFMAWAVYLLMHEAGNFNIFVSAFSAAVVTGVFAEIFARLLRAPSTVFLIPGLVPLFPGSALYYTVSASVGGSWQDVRNYGLETVTFALGIACGASIISAILASFREIRKKRQKNS